ncbi:MAG: hypothetical protein O3C40_02545 [Planctomycetota bacterium]|nr:hypothetical protein [Planctomycetota bacterium]
MQVLYRRAYAGFGLLLFLVTWRLWTPQTEFPQIPFFAALIDVPSWVDWVAIAVVVVALFVAGLSTPELIWRRAMIAFAVAATLLMLLNQHRFQPWAYQFVLFAAIMANCRASRATQLMRWIVVSIYVYSAISKFDYQFLHSLGPQFLSTLTGYVGVASAELPTELQVWLASLFPIGELLVGIGLLVPRTRRLAIFAAVGSHVLLLLILGPWGLSHRPGVLVWNLFFIAQAGMLFAERSTNEEADASEPSRRMTESLCFVLTGIVIAFPASESLGYCDHWPAWELYSPRSSRVQIAIHDSAIDRLPPDVRQHLSLDGEVSAWRQLHIDRWSLESLSVPIYPEDRFQIGVALALADRYELALAIHVMQQSASDRWTGKRVELTFVGYEQLRATHQNFRINFKARQCSP